MLACGEHRALRKGPKDKCVLIVDSGLGAGLGRDKELRCERHHECTGLPQAPEKHRKERRSMQPVSRVIDEHGKSEKEL